jgi:hypothetical protein
MEMTRTENSQDGFEEEEQIWGRNEDRVMLMLGRGINQWNQWSI